jgi:hypothetical protein
MQEDKREQADYRASECCDCDRWNPKQNNSQRFAAETTRDEKQRKNAEDFNPK